MKKLLAILILGLISSATSFGAVQTVINDYAVTPVTTAAYVQILASAPYGISKLQVFDSSGQTLYIATGSPGNEEIVGIIPPGGQDLMLVNINTSARVSLKAVSNSTSGNATSGQCAITFIQQ